MNFKKSGFTLAEMLITLSVIGVVAALILPNFMTEHQEKLRKEQIRTIKYKLTQATDKMKSLDLIKPYDTTEAFVNELKNHYKITKICKNDELSKCWPTKKISTPDGEIDVNSITTGSAMKSLAHGTANTETVGIQTADGTSMILAYSPVCNALDAYRTYEWSTQDGKPVTNATTNCVSAIFDINGSKKPNKLGTDVRTFNSLFGYKQFGATAMTKADCEKNKKKYGINACHYETDYWAGAVKKCADIGLHLPDMQTLANLAGAKYGRTDIGVHTLIMRNDYDPGDGSQAANGDCMNYYKTHDYNGRLAQSDVICVAELPNGINSSVASISGAFWSSAEVSGVRAETRHMDSNASSWLQHNRDAAYVPLCVGD